MKNTRLLISLCTAFFAYTTTIAQTSDNNELLSHIPASASAIYQVDLSQLITKDGWGSIITTLAGSSGKPNDKKIAGMLADPASIGIDVHRTIFVATANEKTFAIIPLADSGTFLKALKETSEYNSFVIRPGKIRSGHQNDEGYAWNDKLMIVTFAKKSKQGTAENLEAQHKAAHPKGTHPQPAKPAEPLWLTNVHYSVAALAGYPNSPFLTDTWLIQGLSDGAALHIWGQEGIFGNLKKNLKRAPIPGNMGSLLADKQSSNKPQATLGSLFFENGRILFSYRVHYSPEMTDLIKSFTSHPLNEDLVNRLPKGDLLGFASIHIDLSNYSSVLDKTGSRHILDSALSAKDLSLDDFVKAIKGDVLVAAIAAPPVKSNADSTPAKPTINFYFVIALNDADKFNKIADKLELFKQKAPSEDDTAKIIVTDTGAAPTPKKPMGHTLKDNILVLGKSQELTDGYFASPGRGHSDLVTSEIRDNPVALVVDFKTLAAFLSDPSMQTNMKAMQAAMFMNKLNTLNLTIGKTPDGDVLTKIEIKMTDQSKNSLESLFELLNPGH